MVSDHVCIINDMLRLFCIMPATKLRCKSVLIFDGFFTLWDAISYKIKETSNCFPCCPLKSAYFTIVRYINRTPRTEQSLNLLYKSRVCSQLYFCFRTFTAPPCSRYHVYSHFFFLKIIRLITIISTQTPIIIGYATGLSSSGMYLKFIPYHPTIRVSGINIAVTTVRNVII